MIPLPLGSVADLGTLIAVLYAIRHEIRPQIGTISAGLVAIARGQDRVDDDRLQADLPVDRDEVDALVDDQDDEPSVVACGGTRRNGS